jgi:hypothetical protein
MKLGAGLKWGILIKRDRLNFREAFQKGGRRSFAVKRVTTVTKIEYKRQNMLFQLFRAIIKRSLVTNEDYSGPDDRFPGMPVKRIASVDEVANAIKPFFPSKMPREKKPGANPSKTFYGRYLRIFVIS